MVRLAPIAYDLVARSFGRAIFVVHGIRCLVSSAAVGFKEGGIALVCRW